MALFGVHSLFDFLERLLRSDRSIGVRETIKRRELDRMKQEEALRYREAALRQAVLKLADHMGKAILREHLYREEVNLYHDETEITVEIVWMTRKELEELLAGSTPKEAQYAKASPPPYADREWDQIMASKLAYAKEAQNVRRPDPPKPPQPERHSNPAMEKLRRSIVDGLGKTGDEPKRLK